jgi:ectoine hydroxylase-related dioxygenase (phytanoyl-CoA dioxygenase family)
MPEKCAPQPADRDRVKPDITGFDVVKLTMEAGDLLIFNSSEPHGIRPNRSGCKVRLAQYISMSPVHEENEALRQRRIASWRDRRAPEGHAFPGDPRNWEQTRYQTAVLSELGEKLLGSQSWYGAADR